ncbi:hypothetical protein TIFTF001_006957 [Ficus carica]|uniref:Uncharacterized protein n=1 Tax=Ficus carica TaxID=3494 RepID=A0AA88CZ71_FICCA|nr:hypothetical protein TIFTF001_006957 [Ficus carica]
MTKLPIERRPSTTPSKKRSGTKCGEKHCQRRAVAPLSVTCKKEAPRNDGDTSVVSAVSTPMLKSSKDTDMQEERQSFGKAKMIIPEFVGSSFIYRRFPRVRMLGATRPGRPPWVPGGYVGL